MRGPIEELGVRVGTSLAEEVLARLEVTTFVLETVVSLLQTPNFGLHPAPQYAVVEPHQPKITKSGVRSNGCLFVTRTILRAT